MGDENNRGGDGPRQLRSNSQPSDSLHEPLVANEEGNTQPAMNLGEDVKRPAFSGARGMSLPRSGSRAIRERPQESGAGGEFVKSIVYGGLDAIVTSFALVASVSGGGIGSGAVLVLGFANLFADGISMGFGDYLSSTTEQQYAANEQAIAEWDVQNDLHTQALGLVEQYEENGMDRSDAEDVVKIFSKYKDLLVEQKMVIEDGLMPPDEDDSAWKNGLVTFTSFLCFGCTPLLSYVVLSPFTDDHNVKFIGACIVTAFALILLGVAKAHISGEKKLNAAVTVLFNGGIAAFAAYGISWVLTNVLEIDEP